MFLSQFVDDGRSPIHERLYLSLEGAACTAFGCNDVPVAAGFSIWTGLGTSLSRSADTARTPPMANVAIATDTTRYFGTETELTSKMW